MTTKKPMYGVRFYSNDGNGWFCRNINEKPTVPLAFETREEAKRLVEELIEWGKKKRRKWFVRYQVRRMK